MVSLTLRVLEAYRTCYDLCNSVLEYLGHDIKESLLFPRNQIGHLRSREYSHRHLPMQHPRPFVKARWHSRLFCEDLQGVALCFLAHLCKIMSKNCTKLAKYILCVVCAWREGTVRWQDLWILFVRFVWFSILKIQVKLALTVIRDLISLIHTYVCLGVKIRTFLSYFKQWNLIFDKVRLHIS